MPDELRAEAFHPLDADERVLHLAKTVQRVGQGAFRTRLLDAYGRRCAITGEHTAIVLDAAHIQPYLGPRSNHVQNGLLLTKEFHALFDAGYVTVTPEHRVRVSRRLREDWQNGHRDYPHDGQRVEIPNLGCAAQGFARLESSKPARVGGADDVHPQAWGERVPGSAGRRSALACARPRFRAGDRGVGAGRVARRLPRPARGQVALAQAYDTVNTTILLPAEQLALPLRGKRARLDRADWRVFGAYAMLPVRVVEEELDRPRQRLEAAREKVRRSLLPESLRNGYLQVLEERAESASQ